MNEELLSNGPCGEGGKGAGHIETSRWISFCRLEVEVGPSYCQAKGITEWTVGAMGTLSSCSGRGMAGLYPVSG